MNTNKKMKDKYTINTDMSLMLLSGKVTVTLANQSTSREYADKDNIPVKNKFNALKFRSEKFKKHKQIVM